MSNLRALPDPLAEPTLAVKRGAAIAGISLRGMYAAIERGDVPSIRIGQRIVIPTARFLAQLGLDEQAKASA